MREGVIESVGERMTKAEREREKKREIEREGVIESERERKTKLERERKNKERELIESKGERKKK